MFTVIRTYYVPISMKHLGTYIDYQKTYRLGRPFTRGSSVKVSYLFIRQVFPAFYKTKQPASFSNKTKFLSENYCSQNFDLSLVGIKGNIVFNIFIFCLYNIAGRWSLLYSKRFCFKSLFILVTHCVFYEGKVLMNKCAIKGQKTFLLQRSEQPL